MTRYFPFLRLTCRLLGFAFIALTHAIAQDPKPATPMVVIDGLGKGTVSLSGPWQFHLGDNPAWSLPQTKDTTGEDGWEQLSTNDTWGDQGHAGYTGFAWYRQHIRLTPVPGASSNFALLMSWVDDAYEVYWNGQLVGTSGTMPPNASHPNQQPGTIFGLGAAREGVLSIRVWKAPLVSNESATGGGFYVAPVIGDPADIAAQKAKSDYAWLRGQQYQYGLLSLYGLLTLLGLLAWIFDRSQRILLWMVVFCGTQLATSLPDALHSTAPYNLISAPLTVLGSLHDVAIWFLLLYLFTLDRNPRWARFTRTLAWIALSSASADALIALQDWSNPLFASWIPGADAFFTAIFTAAELYVFVLLVAALRTRPDSARTLVALAALCEEMVQVVENVGTQGNRYTHWTIGFRFETPMFFLNGNAITAQSVSETMLLFAIIYAVYVHQSQTTRRQNSLEQEFRSARELQQILIPETLPAIPGFAISSAYKPAQEVGGDFFQIIYDSEEGSALVVVGDVSGKGLKAAMAVSLLVGAVRTLAETTSSPASILSGLNRRLHGRLGGGFATCSVLLLQSSGRGSVASAGHLPPLINGVEVRVPSAFPLGITPASAYEEVEIELREGDHLVLYTDGLLEARSRTGELYGFERVMALFSARPTAAEATNAAVAFGQDDDITVLILTRLEVGEESSTEFTAPQASPAHA